jgi:hypothetical protein
VKTVAALAALLLGCSSAAPGKRTTDGPAPVDEPDAAAPGKLDGPTTPAPSPDAGPDKPPSSPDGPTADSAPDRTSTPEAGRDQSGDAVVLPPLTACPRPSIDRLEQWLAWSGNSVPATGSILVRQGNAYVARSQFVGQDWHEVVVPLMNSLDAQVDLTRSAGFLLTYSATADLWMQIRPASRYNGGAKHVTKIPSTGGAIEQRFVPFVASSWTSLPALGIPDYPFAEALKDARAFNFVGNTANMLVFQGLRIDGVTPPCSAAVR